MFIEREFSYQGRCLFGNLNYFAWCFYRVLQLYAMPRDFDATSCLPPETACNPRCRCPTRPSGFFPPRPSDGRSSPGPRRWSTGLAEARSGSAERTGIPLAAEKKHRERERERDPVVRGEFRINRRDDGIIYLFVKYTLHCTIRSATPRITQNPVPVRHVIITVNVISLRRSRPRERTSSAKIFSGHSHERAMSIVSRSRFLIECSFGIWNQIMVEENKVSQGAAWSHRPIKSCHPGQPLLPGNQQIFKIIEWIKYIFLHKLVERNKEKAIAQ